MYRLQSKSVSVSGKYDIILKYFRVKIYKSFNYYILYTRSDSFNLRHSLF